MINCPAAIPRKKDLFDRNMCTRMGKFNEKSEKDFFRAMAVYIYMMDSLLVFFFFLFHFRRKGDAVLDEGTNRAKCTLLA